MKNGLCWINNVLTDRLTAFNCYLLLSTIKGVLHRSGGERVGHNVLWVQSWMFLVHWLEIPLRLARLLLRLLSLLWLLKRIEGSWLFLLQFLWYAFLFRAQSTLSSVSLRIKHWNWLGSSWMYFPVQDWVYSLYSAEDQVLKILLSAVALSYSGLSLLSLCLRTKYQISHTTGRLFPVAISSLAPRNNSRLSNLEYSWANQVLLISSVQKYNCHTTCPIDVTL